jgi:hypothetical protein
MIEASTQFMVGRLSTESGKCNSFNLDGIFGNDRRLWRHPVFISGVNVFNLKCRQSLDGLTRFLLG